MEQSIRMKTTRSRMKNHLTELTLLAATLGLASVSPPRFSAQAGLFPEGRVDRDQPVALISVKDLDIQSHEDTMILGIQFQNSKTGERTGGWNGSTQFGLHLEKDLEVIPGKYTIHSGPKLELESIREHYKAGYDTLVLGIQLGIYDSADRNRVIKEVKVPLHRMALVDKGDDLRVFEFPEAGIQISIAKLKDFFRPGVLKLYTNHVSTRIPEPSAGAVVGKFFVENFLKPARQKPETPPAPAPNVAVDEGISPMLTFAGRWLSEKFKDADAGISERDEKPRSDEPATEGAQPQKASTLSERVENPPGSP